MTIYYHIVYQVPGWDYVQHKILITPYGNVTMHAFEMQALCEPHPLCLPARPHDLEHKFHRPLLFATKGRMLSG